MEDFSKFTSRNWLPGASLQPGRGNKALVQTIEDEIKRKGKITFAQFMQLALYHPVLGYYNTAQERIGTKGDFLTSPETHPVFGALIARQMEQMWRIAGSPRLFTVVEMGAGAGALCRDIMTFARKAYSETFYKALRYTIIEKSPDFVARQKERFTAARLPKSKLIWVEGLEDIPDGSITGCFLSNELPDAFPVHRVVMREGKLREIYVGIEKDQFINLVDEPSSAALGEYFNRVGVSLPEGCEGEVNLIAINWMREVGRKLEKGFVITIDYGHPAGELYTENRPRGTILCYFRHTFNENPFVRVGRQDITAHVDFTALALAGDEAGLVETGLLRQDDFLKNLGITAFLADLRKTSQASLSDYTQNARAIEELIAPDDLGRLRVLVQHKGLPKPTLIGLSASDSDTANRWGLPLPRLSISPPNPQPFPWQV